MNGLVHTYAPRHDTATAQEAANVDLIRRFRATPVGERGQYLAPDFVRHRAGAATLHAHGPYDPAGLPDREDVILDMVAKDDVVWAVWRVTGTHRGTLFGIPASGNSVDALEVGIWRIADGRIAEAWFMADELAWARQMGVPMPGPLASPPTDG